MTTSVAPLEAQVFAALKAALASLFDAPFSGKGSTSGTTLTVSDVSAGAVTIGMVLSSSALSPGTFVAEFITGRGGAGTYRLNQAPLQPIRAGAVFTGGTDVRRGQVNRVSSPSAPNYVVYWPGISRRLGTNVDSFEDCRFTAQIAGETMTVSDVDFGAIELGRDVFGEGVASGTKVVAFGTGSGGPGTYVVAPTQTVASEVMAAGSKTMEQPIELHVQIDAHGPNSYENAVRISTVFRDEDGVRLFAQSGVDVTPLHADDPRQAPFEDDQSQVEERWIVTAVLQVNAATTTAQQFADELTPEIVNVDAEYPPA